MGFLAFLVIGGLCGVFAWVSYPGERKSKSSFKNLLLTMLFGVLAGLVSSLAGQWLGLFQSGQMLEWLSAVVASCLAGCLYAAALK
jgi:uncharacterized membrane protein YeaQ/YmgE (transglycosylase-associated protein family)